MTNVLRHPPGPAPLIAASILSADFAAMGADCRGVLGLDAGPGEARPGDGGVADLLHLDVMDGHFVPNLTMGPDLCRAVRRACPETTLDVHLMVTSPEQFFAPFAQAGADHLTFHLEAGPEDDAGSAALAVERAKQVRDLGLTAGLALNPGTRAERVLAIAEEFDLVLIMSVQPGFSGQSFRAEVMEKARLLRREMSARIRLQVDGGVSPENAARCRDAGFDVLVSASAIFGKSSWPDRYGVVRRLRGSGLVG